MCSSFGRYAAFERSCQTKLYIFSIIMQSFDERNAGFAKRNLESVKPAFVKSYRAKLGFYKVLPSEIENWLSLPGFCEVLPRVIHGTVCHNNEAGQRLSDAERTRSSGFRVGRGEGTRNCWTIFQDPSDCISECVTLCFRL